MSLIRLAILGESEWKLSIDLHETRQPSHWHMRSTSAASEAISKQWNIILGLKYYNYIQNIKLLFVSERPNHKFYRTTEPNRTRKKLPNHNEPDRTSTKPFIICILNCMKFSQSLLVKKFFCYLIKVDLVRSKNDIQLLWKWT